MLSTRSSIHAEPWVEKWKYQNLPSPQDSAVRVLAIPIMPLCLGYKHLQSLPPVTAGYQSISPILLSLFKARNVDTPEASVVTIVCIVTRKWI